LAKVVGLDGKPLKRRKRGVAVNGGLVNHLRKMLESAEAGEIVSAGYAIVWKSGGISSGYAWESKGGHMASLVGAAYMLTEDLTEAMRNTSETE